VLVSNRLNSYRQNYRQFFFTARDLAALLFHKVIDNQLLILI